MAKAKGESKWAEGFVKMMEIYVNEYPDDSVIREGLADGGVVADCIDKMLEVSAVGGYPSFDFGKIVPANIYTNYVYSKWLGYNSEATEMYNKLLRKCGEPDVDEIGKNGEGFYTRDNAKVLDGGGDYHSYNNTFTEIFRHSFGIEEVYLAFLLCDSNLETFYEFVGYGTEPEPEPSDLPADRQTLVGDLYSTVRPIQMMHKMLEADKPIDRAELRKYIAQLDMKCKALSADFENILNM